MLRRYPTLIAPMLLLFSGSLIAGCGGQQDSEASREAAQRRAKQRAAAQTDALLGSIKNQLAALPEAVQLDLRPPAVIVDSRRSTDGEDIEGIVVRPEGVPPVGPANLLRVPRRNGRFRSADVRSGDSIKYFAKFSDETAERLRLEGDTDIVTMEAVEFQVAQVLSENELLIVGGLAREITVPLKVEIWRNVDDRMNEISRQLAAYRDRRDPPRGWQPSPDEAELRLLHERVNQWLRQSGGIKADRSETISEWLATLPDGLTSDDKLSELLNAERIASGPFVQYDSRLLQQAVWLRDIARRERGDSFEPREQAVRLFDWVVRNLVLLDATPPSDPWEAMLHGRATAEERAWVFVRLCRSIGITAFVLPVETDSGTRPLVGVVDEQGVAIFDPQLGLPLGSVAGQPVADRSLADFVADDGLLRAYDLPDSPYPVTAAKLADVTPRVVADAFSLSGRAAVLENALTGADALVLTIDPDAVAEAIAAVAAEAPAAELWAFPYETMSRKLKVSRDVRNEEVKAFLPFAWRPPLWKGRVLGFRGVVEQKSARSDDLAMPQNDFRAAQQSLMDRQLRPRDSRLAEIASEVKRDIYFRAKAIATYWLATTAIERGDYQNAVYWLENETLQRPATEWLPWGVRYSAARANEGLGELEAAAELLEASSSPQRQGDLLRAAWLRSSIEPGAEAAAEADPSTDQASAQDAAS